MNDNERGIQKLANARPTTEYAYTMHSQAMHIQIERAHVWLQPRIGNKHTYAIRRPTNLGDGACVSCGGSASVARCTDDECSASRRRASSLSRCEWGYEGNWRAIKEGMKGKTRSTPSVYTYSIQACGFRVIMFKPELKFANEKSRQAKLDWLPERST